MSSITYKHNELPENVISLLQNGKFVHLGTSSLDAIPDVALMNYYYLPKQELYSNGSDPNSTDRSVDHTYIILSTSKASLKYKNIEQNPHVSLLFHDWTVAKGKFNNETTTADNSNLFQILTNLNQTELSQLSATLTGKAHIVSNEQELVYYKTKLSKENPDAKVYIDGGENSIVLVQITSAKVCDKENHQSVYQS